jgi:hypothetical protein
MTDTSRMLQNQISSLSLPDSEMMSKNQIARILESLFDDKKIPMITDLDRDEIALITRISVTADLKNLKAWTEGIDMFMRLRLSSKRKSREEIIRAVASTPNKRSFGQRFRDLIKPGDDQ